MYLSPFLSAVSGLSESLFAKTAWRKLRLLTPKIDLIVDKYCGKRPYRCTLEDKKEIEEQIGKLLEKGLIEESYSPFAAPVTLAYKRDEGKRSRLCIDFRDLNKIIIPQAQPFPIIDDLIIKTRNSKSVIYLGHIIENNTVRPVKDNLTSIQNFPTPKTQKNIRQFLGKVNFYHEYIPKSSILLDPLHRLLRKNEKFIWAEDCERSFTEIKKLLCSQPVLEIFDKDLLTRIYTDASLEGIGAIFKQVQHNGIEKPVAYFSKKLNESQKRKKAIYLECLAIKEAVKYWQHWLIGRRFEVYSDHKPLESMNIKARTDEELGDLMYYLSQYDFQIKYVPGKDNAEADCLSRNPVLEPTRNLTENIKKICKTCEVCIKNKSRGQEKYGRMSQLGPATRPFEIMSMDTIGGFGGLRSTKKYLHLLVDHFTRYAFIATSKTQNATDFIKLVKNVLETDKIETILTDQYPGINSREFKEYLEENDVRLIFTAYLLDGTDTSILPEELRREKHQEDWMKDKELALERTIKSHDYKKKLFDKNRKHHEFNTGDMVYIENGNRLNRKKLDDLRIGPLEIIEKISNSIYRIKTNRKKSGTSLFHITKLIPISDIDKDADEED
ncbi:uncharacterized protein LOC120357968 [Solenopsis invicta]|uniref:uncharacterized protein LOC120357968 n=1 Tax=Solenopsis invicta TaxID=13686 RepID=UPI00193D551B|nr:uncharacterized protein LOC120357968 [Solenopsis invicta]